MRRYVIRRLLSLGLSLLVASALIFSVVELVPGDPEHDVGGQLPHDAFREGTLFGELAFAEETPSPRAATVVATSDGTIGKWSYAKLNAASTGLQSKMLKIYFRLAAERLKDSDERYLRLYQRHLKEDGAG